MNVLRRRPQINDCRSQQGAGPMRTSRIVRSFVLAGTAAALSLLSLATTVMACTGGGTFPH
jgi:hypothetical protein